MTKIHVVYIIDTLKGGGSQRILSDLATGLDGERFRVSVCSLTEGGVWEGALRERGIPVTVLYKRLGMDFRVLPRLRKLLRDWQPDIVQTFLFTSNAFGRVGAILAGVRILVATEHSQQAKSAVRKMIDRALARFTSKFVVVTREIERQVIDTHHVPAGRVTVIEEGLDFDTFAPRATSPDTTAARIRAGGEAVIGNVGRLEYPKCHDDFVMAMALVVSRRPNTAAWIAGVGNLQADIERRILAENLQSKIRLLGYRADVAEVLRQFDLFVLCSEYEGLPIALLEAVACGIPFVATTVGAIPELFTDRVHGRLVPPRQPQTLADMILWSLDNYHEALAMAGRARQIIQRMTCQRMINQHQALYEDLVHAKPR